MSIHDQNEDIRRDELNAGGEAYTPVYARRNRKKKGVRTWMVLAPVSLITLGGLTALAVTADEPQPMGGAEVASEPASAPMIEAPLAPTAAETETPLPTFEPPAPIPAAAPAAPPARRAAPAPSPAPSPQAPAEPEPAPEPVGPRPYEPAPRVSVSPPAADPAPIVVQVPDA
ncbi:hypothetical protein [Brevundimonas balnearis]|uniref:Uncharacterized protein n=1 Tax=Brevundimonas balnearis TaxID=1572858 RepID=A0ABV6R6D0_9CAUL